MPRTSFRYRPYTKSGFTCAMTASKAVSTIATTSGRARSACRARRVSRRLPISRFSSDLIDSACAAPRSFQRDSSRPRSSASTFDPTRNVRNSHGTSFAATKFANLSSSSRSPPQIQHGPAGAILKRARTIRPRSGFERPWPALPTSRPRQASHSGRSPSFSQEIVPPASRTSSIAVPIEVENLRIRIKRRSRDSEQETEDQVQEDGGRDLDVEPVPFPQEGQQAQRDPRHGGEDQDEDADAQERL